MKHPNENRTLSPLVLEEAFQKKGYQCIRMVEHDATITIFKHEKKKEAGPDQIVEGLLPSNQIFLAN